MKKTHIPALPSTTVTTLSTSGSKYFMAKNNEKDARTWANRIEQDLMKVAAWTAHHVASEKEEEWEALHRIATLHNNMLAESIEWAHKLTVENLHFHCAIQRLLPTAQNYLRSTISSSPEGGPPSYSTPLGEVCSRCTAWAMPEPSGIIREAAAAAIAAPSLPEGEGTLDPKKQYLVKYILDTLLRNKKPTRKEIVP